MKKRLNCQMSDQKELLPVTFKEKRNLLVQSIWVVVILDYFFYRSLLALLPLFWIGLQYYKMEKRTLQQKKKEEAREQFKELMLLVSNSQRAGCSVENAFISGYKEMKSLYGKESSICRMLLRIRIAKENRKPLPGVWAVIGEETGISEIQEFAKVYEISYQKSGNVAAVMEKTAGIIIEKVDTEKEIAVLLSAKRLEQKIMNVMPFLIMLYISVTSPGYFDRLYHTLAGALIMSLCLGIYLLAYRSSLKMVDIRI